MGSLTKVTKIKRKRRRKASGKLSKRARAKAGTPKFPIQPEGTPAAKKKAPQAKAAPKKADAD